MKKIMTIIILLAIFSACLHFFGDRDLTQVPAAFGKLGNDGKVSSFFTDINTIFEGGKIGVTGVSEDYAKKIMYRWTDEFGQLHLSEKKPTVENFQEIRLGDLKLQLQPGMTTKEIESVLNNGKGD